ncbi:ACT domain-containing protein [Ruminococcaceae bacterium OttesenSCG-928-L11]|nr:ACT domain-containing protein [Ruminococcaceae bacterium OttesenSCG-928-L11]
MPDKHKYYLVEASVLPEVFLKVVQAKQYLAQGKAQNLSKAAQMAGISRSALYKYKDAISPYLGTSTQHMATMYAALADEPGVLSALLGLLCEHGANILTINQSIPVDGVAPVTVSMRTEKLSMDPEELTAIIEGLDGVVEIKLLAN